MQTTTFYRPLAYSAVLSLIVSAAFFSPQLNQPAFALIALLTGAMVLWLVLSRVQMSLLPQQAITKIPAQPFHWWQYPVILAGVGCLFFMAQGGSPSRYEWIIVSPMLTETQFRLFCAGIVLIAFGFIGLQSRRALSGVVGSKMTIGMIILLGFALRIVDLENQVHHFLDEMHFSNGVVHLWNDPLTPLFTPINYIASFAWLYPFLQTYSVEVFGPTLTGLRIVSVIFGTLTIPAVYLLARWLFDRPTALVAAFLLATFPPHIHFSRLALNNIADPFFGTLAFAFFARGLQRRDRASFVLAGVCLGLTQYFYEGGKLIFPPVMALWMGWVFLREREIRKENSRAFGLLSFVALMVALPLFIMLAAWGSPYVPRTEMQTFAGENWQNVLESGDPALIVEHYLQARLLPSITHLFSTPDASVFYYAGHTALILPVLLPGFFAGVVVLFWRRRIELLFLLALTILGNSLIEKSAWTPRYVVIFPALMLTTAVGLRILWRLVNMRIASTRTKSVDPLSFRAFIGLNRTGWIAPTLLCIIGVFSVTYYFFPHLAVFNRQFRGGRDHQDVAWRVADLPPDTHTYLFTTEPVFLPHFQGMEDFWQRPLNISVVVDAQLHFTEEERNRRIPVAIFVTGTDSYLISDLDFMFDLPEPQYSPYNLPREQQYILYYLPPLTPEEDP